MNNESRKLLEPYACLLARAHQRIIDMSDADLAALDAAVKDARRDNCWYAVYQVARILEPEIEGQKMLRYQTRSRKQG